VNPSTEKLLQLGDALAAELDADGRRYWGENRRRIVAAVAGAARLLTAPAGRAEPSRILDVAPALELPLLARTLPEARLSTLGWADHRYRPADAGAHHPLDLNDTVTPDRCPAPEPHDLVLLLEVIEHVHVSPLHVFRYLHDWVRPGGHLMVSTPNAAWLRHRWRLLCGRNPYELIREDARNPGHFRELTRRELCDYLERAGFRVTTVRIDNLYTFGSAAGRRFTRLSSLLPASFRHDMLVVAERPV
jgi:predicted SAM-dependent methyltransferase